MVATLFDAFREQEFIFSDVMTSFASQFHWSYLRTVTYFLWSSREFRAGVILEYLRNKPVLDAPGVIGPREAVFAAAAVLVLVGADQDGQRAEGHKQPGQAVRETCTGNHSTLVEIPSAWGTQS